MTPETLSEAIARLVESGFRHGLRAQIGRLRDTVTGESYSPESLGIAEWMRFDGESDPDEEVVLFALLSPAGSPLGTYATAFGPGIAAEDGSVLPRLGGVAVRGDRRA